MKGISLTTVPYGSLFTDSERPVSVSMHSAMLDASREAVVPFCISERYLESAVHNVRTGLLKGVELSPRLAVLANDYADRVGGDALAVGASNVITLSDGNALIGSNTHVSAFRNTVTPKLIDRKLASPMAVVFGTGYAARIAVWTLSTVCSMVCIVSRDPTVHNDGMRAMETMLGNLPGGARIETSGYDEAVIDPYDIVVNATTMGEGDNKCSPLHLGPLLSAGSPREGQLYVDFAVGYHRSLFLPGKGGVDGYALAAYAAADSICYMRGTPVPERIWQTEASYASLGERLYGRLSSVQ